MQSTPPLLFYRYITRPYYMVDQPVKAEVTLETMIRVRSTPCGYWVCPLWARECGWEERYKRWVSATGHKRYCYPTKEEAWESYKARRSKRVKHLERELEVAKFALKLTQDMARPD